MNVDAQATFEHLILQVQKSNLNYKLELSPFSAVVYLKKSLIKDRFGNVLLPLPFDIETSLVHRLQAEKQFLSQKILHHEAVMNSLRSDYENAVNNSEETHAVNKKLETEINHLQSILERVQIKKENTIKPDLCDRKVSDLKNEITEKDNKINIYLTVLQEIGVPPDMD